MNPRINITSEDNTIGSLLFTISEIDTCIINSIRRVLLSEIPTFVFKTFPDKENACIIKTNTSRLTNEVLKQRLSCIPIHISDLSMPINEFYVKVHKINNSSLMEFVTTKDFMVYNAKTNEPISDIQRDKIFPKNNITNEYIDFCRLRPKIVEELNGEELEFVATIDISTAKENSMYNVVSKATYGMTKNDKLNNEMWEAKQAELTSNNLNAEEIEFEKKNWNILEAQKFIIPNSFDFIVETVGVFSNRDLIKKSCDIMINKCEKFINLIQSESLLYEKSSTTLPNCFDIILQGEDYTLGKAIESVLYIQHYDGDKTLAFLGFNKKHPHDIDSILRIAFKNETIKNLQIEAVLLQYFNNALTQLIDVYKQIQSQF